MFKHQLPLTVSEVRVTRAPTRLGQVRQNAVELAAALTTAFRTGNARLAMW